MERAISTTCRVSMLAPPAKKMMMRLEIRAQRIQSSEMEQSLKLK